MKAIDHIESEFKKYIKNISAYCRKNKVPLPHNDGLFYWEKRRLRHIFPCMEMIELTEYGARAWFPGPNNTAVKVSAKW